MTQPLLNNRFAIVEIKRVSDFSKVFFALDTYQNPPRQCEIEVYRPIFQQSEIEQEVVQAFQKEIARIKQLSLSHPNLPEIYTFFYKFQAYYIVREIVEGITLKEKVQTTGKFSPKRVRKILVELLSVLNYIHQQGVVHQKVHPQNIVLRHSDRQLLLIEFGSIRNILAQFSTHQENNIGYYPAQVSDKPTPADDLYSLGLTAIYLLTAKEPNNWSIDPHSGTYQVPREIHNADSHLAAVIARAIAHNEGGYSSAQTMLEALSPPQSQTLFHKNPSTGNQTNTQLQTANSTPNQGRRQNPNWLIILLSITGALTFMNLCLTAWYTWRLTQNNAKIQSPTETPPSIIFDFPQPESTSEPSNDDSQITEVPLNSTPESSNSSSEDDTELVLQPKKPSNSNIQDETEIPIFTTGTSETKLKTVLGEPNDIKTGYWDNSSAWIYLDHANELIDLGYLFDLDTGKLRQTEIAIAPAAGLATMTEILDGLLEGNLNQSITQGLERVYQREDNQYSFELKDWEGTIERDENDKIYIGIWEEDFH